MPRSPGKVRPKREPAVALTARRRRALEADGWKFGSAEEFLGLDAAEAELVEWKLRLSASVRRRRTARRITQAALARRLGSSQSRVAKLEAGDPGVSIELLVRTLFALGAGRRDLAALMVEQDHRGR